MKLTAGETVTIQIDDEIVTVKIEDASKGDIVTGRIENVQSGNTYQVGQICDFERSKIQVND